MRSSLRFKLLFCLVGVALAAGCGLGVFHALSRNSQRGPVVEASQGTKGRPVAGSTSEKEAQDGKGEGIDSVLLVSVL